MSFASDLARFTAQNAVRLRAIHRDSVADLAARLDARMPVDTGRARGNNVAANHVRPVDDVDQFRFDPTGEAALPRMQAVIDQGFGAVTYFSNGIDYVWDLEYGSSRQAPQGMFRVTAAEWPALVAAAIERHR